jgi:hypothetical protein
MTNEKLYEVLGDIDEKHIQAARRTTAKAKKPAWVKWGAMAACLCLVIAGSTVLWNQNIQTPDAGNGGGVTDGTGNYSVSVAVYPASETIENVASAEVVSLTESEALSHKLAEHLPQQLPDGFHYGQGMLYNTAMNDGTQYNMLRVEYISGTIPEQQFIADGEVIPDSEETGDLFTVCVLNYEPETKYPIYSSVEEVTLKSLEESGAAYIHAEECYIGVFVESAEPEIVLEALKNIK